MEDNAESGRQLDDLDTAASSGYGGCCDTGVDLATLLALLAGKIHIF